MHIVGAGSYLKMLTELLVAEFEATGSWVK